MSKHDYGVFYNHIFLFKQEAGLRELNKVYEERDGLRQFLASMVLLGYHLVLSYFIGNEENYNLQLCNVSNSILEYKGPSIYDIR